MLSKKAVILGIFLTAFTLSFIVFPKTNQKAYAKEEKFLRVITEDTVFYSDENCFNPIFFLPYTYYVKVLEEKADTAHVQIGGLLSPTLDGYVKTELLYDDGQTVTNAYPTKVLTTLCTAVLYEDAFSSLAIQYIFKGRKLDYYGEYVNDFGKRVYCVSYNGNLGYVAEETVEPFAIENHPNELTFLKNETPPDSNGNQSGINGDLNSNNSADLAIKIIVIGCLVFAGIIALYVALRPKKDKRKTTGFYDENDYE